MTDDQARGLLLGLACGDADTVGAVAGAVAGAQFGASKLPEEWLAAIEATEELETLAKRLPILC